MYLTLGGPLQTPGNGEQGGLARARGTHDRHELPGAHRQVDVVQGGDLALSVTERTSHVVQGNHRLPSSVGGRRHTSQCTHTRFHGSDLHSWLPRHQTVA